MELGWKRKLRGEGDRKQGRAEIESQIPPATAMRSQPAGGVPVTAAQVGYGGLRPNPPE